MDLKAKSWAGNMYNKFEDLCSEVEQVMSQDAVKYVENQVQTVGVRVKKFCSEVMQDIRPESSSIHSVKDAAADFSLEICAHEVMEKKPKSSLKEHARGIYEKLMEDAQVIKSGGKSKHGGVYKRRNVGVTSNSLGIDPPVKMARTSSPPSGMRNRTPLVCETQGGYGIMASRDRTERICDHISEKTNIPTVGKDVAASENRISDEFSEQKPQDSGFTPSFRCLSSRSSTGTRMDDDDDAISQADSGTSSNTIGNEEPVDREQNFESDKRKKTDGVQQEVETVEHIKGSHLMETCVMVGEDKVHVPQEPVKQNSYKNKIWSAFSSRRREYQQLAALYADQPLNAEAEEKAISDLRMKSNAKLSATEFPDPEWELL
ncbi:uncharacterized protein LOC116010644 isoform X1 [Ipomoea triloba]|uniref:uncharacterized protein LOC116010644 isoform X1 n=1 Tax=Ipomoea triloba TaxID=35885 RepID=UPI00125D33AE|nr:uncharacterized protein LOC116010644 isoform X1 [Ipomoea triloba]